MAWGQWRYCLLRILTKAVHFDHIILTVFILQNTRIDAEPILVYNPTMIKLLYSNETNAKVPSLLFKTVLKRLIEVEPEITQTEVELLLTDDKTIQKLNKQYRNKDMPTDVLSFGFSDTADSKGLPSKSLGQIVISVDRARQQAKDIGQSLNKELQFLFTHGTLHLLGYDHENPEDEKIMLKKTYQILTNKL